ncbi:hypothetical protein KY285_023621 [Solanum tuberosum]|nr:hypothetical protein KY285_023621 [Solanum tuberosum]
MKSPLTPSGLPTRLRKSPQGASRAVDCSTCRDPSCGLVPLSFEAKAFVCVGSTRAVSLSTCHGPSHELLPLAYVAKAWSTRSFTSHGSFHVPWTLSWTKPFAHTDKAFLMEGL